MPEMTSGNSYVLVAGDYFTSYLEVYPILNQEAVIVAKKLTDELFVMFSLPKQLHSDQGRVYESDLIAGVRKLLHTEKSQTIPYNPQGDGSVEKYNHVWLNMLSITVKDHHHIRKVCIPQLILDTYLQEGST